MVLYIRRNRKDMYILRIQICCRAAQNQTIEHIFLADQGPNLKHPNLFIYNLNLWILKGLKNSKFYYKSSAQIIYFLSRK